ncbi:DUF3795 domain-containing protein [bacterium]|nr:DUF3795 domain-containing protein [bacterium]
MSIEEVGCCGAYCKTCKANINFCKGCKLGYANGERDINIAKCKIKVCCIKKGYCSCADCQEYALCSILQGFYGKNGYKYKKYKQATMYIMKNGYEKFLEIADKWVNALGKIKSQEEL